MVRKILICSLLVFLMAAGHAQTPEFYGYLGLETNTNKSSRGIIREQGISYYENKNQGYFVYVPNFSVMTVNQVMTPKGWYIRDFRVVDSIAYFCGIDSNSITALLGHFNIYNLQSGIGNIVFHRDNGIRTKLSILNRIAVKNNKDTITLMAIGRVQAGINPEMNGADRVLYLENYSSSSGSIFSPSNTNELFWDVVLTDNYFVTSGTVGLNTTVLTMRRVPIGTPQTTFPTFFSGYQYLCTNPFKSGVRATNLKNDSIVMAAYVDSTLFLGSGIANTMMCLFTIDVPTTYMEYAQKLYTRIPYNSSSMLPPREMVYLPDSAALMVIDTASITSTRNNSYIVRLTPYLTPAVLTPWIILYIPPFYYNRDCTVEFNSLIAISSNGCIAAAGANWLKIDFQGGSLPSMHHRNNCITVHNLDCFVSKVYQSFSIPDGASELYNRPLMIEMNPVKLCEIYSCPPGPDQPDNNIIIDELIK